MEVPAGWVSIHLMVELYMGTFRASNTGCTGVALRTFSGGMPANTDTPDGMDSGQRMPRLRENFGLSIRRRIVLTAVSKDLPGVVLYKGLLETGFSVMN
jgi:hypothetical protein